MRGVCNNNSFSSDCCDHHCCSSPKKNESDNHGEKRQAFHIKRRMSEVGSVSQKQREGGGKVGDIFHNPRLIVSTIRTTIGPSQRRQKVAAALTKASAEETESRVCTGWRARGPARTPASN